MLGGRVVSLFRHHFPVATAVQLLAEAALFFAAVIVAIAVTSNRSLVSPFSAILPAFTFAVVLLLVNGALGLYRRDRLVGGGTVLVSGFLALILGVAVAYLLFFFLPDGHVAQDSIGFAVLYALVGVPLLRRALVSPRAARLLAHRVLVIGTGPEARAVDRALAASNRSAIVVVGFYEVAPGSEPAVARSRIIPAGASFEDAVNRLGVAEVIVAVQEQRGGVLPLRQLLDCRLRGVRVTDFLGFFERVRGEVPVESLKASWLIFGDGFRQDWFRTAVKRVFDLVISLALLILALPVLAITAAAIFLETGGPIIYRQDRAGRGGIPFTLLKFRSMRLDAEGDGDARWATRDDERVTRVGRFLRRSRIDELPQLWNVLKGEMSFVGPRPERPCFVAELTQAIPFYAVRHSVKPGITGWAQVRYSYAASVTDTATKLRFDLYYVKNHSLLLDVLILVDTVRVVLLGEGAR